MYIHTYIHLVVAVAVVVVVERASHMKKASFCRRRRWAKEVAAAFILLDRVACDLFVRIHTLLIDNKYAALSEVVCTSRGWIIGYPRK